MSTRLIDLTDRLITDRGEVVAKYELLVRKALSGEVFTELPTLYHPDIDTYNERSGRARPIAFWEDDEGGIVGPDPDTFDWTIPKKFQELDITELCAQALLKKRLDKDEYIDRLAWEIERMNEMDMFPFVRCLLYVTSQFRENGVVWGVGRGSSCASLVMYLLDINRIDPVKYGIPAEEFFK